MDREVLIQHLAEVEEIGEPLLHTLKSVLREVSHIPHQSAVLPVFTQQLIQNLVPFACEYKVIKFKETLRVSEMRARLKRDPESAYRKSLPDKTMDALSAILSRLCVNSATASQFLVEKMLEHADSHRDCTHLYVMLLRLYEQCEEVRKALKDQDAVGVLVSYLSGICAHTAVYNTAMLPPLHQRRESEHTKLANTGVMPNVLNKSGFYESDSFTLELNILHGHTVSSRALRRACRERAEDSDPMIKSPRVPHLVLPTQAEVNPSRSSRRADLNKTISTRSGKIGSWGDRVDASSPVAMSPLPRNETPKIHNASAAFDFDQSFVAEETTNPQDYMTPSEKLRNLAIQIGEACLTADLTALIAQKRDSELELVAKKTLFPVANLDLKRGKPKELEPINVRGRSHSLTSLLSQDLRKEIDKENMQIITKKKEKTSKTLKLRATLLTLVCRLLHMYDVEELQTVRSPINILFAHVTSNEYASERSAIVNGYQELGTHSDDEDELLDDEMCCFPASDVPVGNPFKPDLQSFRQKREEAASAQGNTVPGNSPRGARASDSVGGSIHPSLPGFSFDSSIANESSHVQKDQKDLILPEDIAVFSILELYSQQTEFTHSQAVSPALTLASTVISSSHMMDSLSPYKPFRSTNVSILPSPQLSQLLEEQGPISQKDLTLWVEGIGWPNLGEGLKEKLRKHSDMFLWRLSRRLQWAQESLSSRQLFDVETEMFQLLARYLRICRTRVSLFQALDVVCEAMLAAKKRIIDEWQGSRPPSPREPVTSKSHCCAFLKVLTELLLQAQTFETLKLLNEIFVNNDLWAECVRVYVMTVLHPTVKDVYEARVVIRYYRSIAIFLRRLVLDLSLDAKSSELSAEQKQWKQTIRHVLGGLTWMTSPVRGMIPRYLHKNTPESPNSNQASLTTFYRHLPLMKEVLKLIADLLWFSGRFSNFRNEEHSLFYIRMHFISFLKLYTNNHAKSEDDQPLLNATMGNQRLTASFNEVLNSSEYSKSCFLLSKLHLQCLFAYARHRNPDITRKFYQFRILEFLTREIDLEYDISLRRARFLQLRKEEKQRFDERMRHKAGAKSNISLPAPSIPEAPSANSSFSQTPVDKKPTGFKLNLASLKPKGEDVVEKAPEAPPKNLDGSFDVVFPNPNLMNQAATTGKKPGIPLLKLGSIDDQKRLPEPKSTKSKSMLPELSPSDLKIEKPKIPALKMSLLTQDPEQKEREKQEFVKSIIFKEEETEENYGLTKLERSLNKRNPKMQLGLDLQSSRQQEDQMSSLEVMKEPEFYERERRQREIYADSDLQVNIIGLIICLLLTPTRGTLDELYCYQYPINNGKPNVLFLLHHHLNHPSNQHILPKLLNLVSRIVPTLAGQRLLKLLCTAFFDPSIYSNWQKIATGAYGTVYQCSTGLHDPAVVAIKKMSVPKTIYERCVLHDIFTEISCLEEFRLERCVTDLYDYGVDENDYYIVMKCYPMSLKQWRLQLKGSLDEHMPELLTVYREILKAVQTIHRHNVTHYDLKCDNILFEDPIEEYKITIGDFGECRMFVNADDELCLRNKGTEPIKSPEMLALTIAAKKETEKYDRRRKVGTTRASDIWSLGCLLYELLTGEFLFNYPDWALFYIRVTSATEQLLVEEMTEKINNNVYLIDFLKYLLVRDPRLRPSIDNVLTRFEHLHALLISAPPVPSRITSAHTLRLGGLVTRSQELIAEFGIEEGAGLEPWSPSFLQITEDVFICSEAFLRSHILRLISYGITHVIQLQSEPIPDLKRFRVHVFDHPFQCLPMIMDFLRAIQISGGRVIFVDGEKVEVRVALLLALSELFNASCFETWTLVNSQVFYISLPQSALSLMSEWTYLQSQIKQYMNTFPRYQCLCGSCVLVLKRHLADPKLQFSKACACARQYRNVETSECPSPGCGDYLAVLKHMHNLTWDNVVWGFGEKDDFEIGPSPSASAPIILNSVGLAQNLELARVVEKRWPTSEVWKLYKCCTCHLWVIAINANDSRVAFTMNIPVSNQQGILASRGNAVRVPILRKFRLSSYNISTTP